MKQDELGSRWVELCRSLGATGETTDHYLQLIARYSQPHRSYHDLGHLVNRLAFFDRFREISEDPVAVEAALWFLDVAFEPEKSEHQLLSTELFREVAEALEVDSGKTEKVAHLIESLQDPHPRTPDERLVADIELAFLGRSAEEFDRGEELLRQEFEPVIRKSREAFELARAAELARLAGRESIYWTEPFRNAFENQARQNLDRALKTIGIGFRTDFRSLSLRRLYLKSPLSR